MKKETIFNLKELFSSYRKSILLIFIFAIISTVFLMISPRLLGMITSELVAHIHDPKEIRFSMIGMIVVVLLLLYVLSMIGSYLQGFWMAKVSAKVTYELRAKISKKLSRLSIRYYDQKQPGDILSVLSNDVDNIALNLTPNLSQLIIAITLLLGVIFMMLITNIWMTLLALGLFVLSVVLLGVVVTNTQKYFTKRQELLGELTDYSLENYSGHMIVTLFHHEESAKKQFRKLNQQLYQYSWKGFFFSGFIQPLVGFLNQLGYVGIAVLGGLFAIQRVLLVGDVQAFFQYFRLFTQQVGQIGSSIGTIQSMIASFERIFSFLALEELSWQEGNLLPDTIRGTVSFQGVSFGYTKKLVVEQIDLNIRAGQKIAIVGPTGAGKTTLMQLLMRFYDPTDGVIKVDGKDIRTLDLADLRRHIGIVLQDAWLFQGTIRENILYAKPEATDAVMQEVVERIQASHFIHTLSDSYNTMLDEDIETLSVGQKQLLCIARTLLKDPEILILDEATSSVDTRTDQFIQNALVELQQNRTCIIIAHRLSTVRNADMIVVMDDGKIVEKGKHQTLLRKKGIYYDLYTAQLKNGKSQF